MIELQIPVEQIPYIRTIEGRKFKNGLWLFPVSAKEKLVSLGLLSGAQPIEQKVQKQYILSNHLRKYQKEIVNTALNENCYAVFADTGTGKTIMGLEIAKHYKSTLVLCPLSIIETSWIGDCNKFYPELKIVNLWANSRKKRLEILSDYADIYVANYDSFKIIKNEILKKKFNCIIVDESAVMKNMGSQITQELLSVAEAIPHRFILSGCPTPNHNSEIFPQMKFVDPDVFGNNYYGFLAKYFTQDMANPHVWFQTQENKDRYFERLRNKAVFLKKEDCVDLPDKTFEIRNYALSGQQKMIYTNLVDNIKDNINTWSKFEFTAKLMKLREVLSGFVIDKSGAITDFQTEKDVLLKECIEEIGDKPIIVWCQFNHEIERLAELFCGIGITSKTKNRDNLIRDFQNNKIKILFVHPQLFGKGLTFTNCNYNIYYSLSFSYEEFKQSQDRIHRIGQINKCTYIILQGKDTIDEKIYNCLQNKKSAVDELYLQMAGEISND